MELASIRWNKTNSKTAPKILLLHGMGGTGPSGVRWQQHSKKSLTFLRLISAAMAGAKSLARREAGKRSPIPPSIMARTWLIPLANWIFIPLGCSAIPWEFARPAPLLTFSRSGFKAWY